MKKVSLNYYIASGFRWAPGDIITNRTFAESPHKNFFVETVPGHLATIADYMARRNTELQLEELRKVQFASMPSRKDALFLNKSIDDAKSWQDRGARATYTIYELSPISEINSSDANYIWYNYCVRLHKNPIAENRHIFSADQHQELAHSMRAYWCNQSTEAFQSPSRTETLFVGKLEVLGTV